MITASQPLMDDHELAVLEVFIWFALIFFTILAAYAAYRRFVRDGDVVAEANELLDEHRSIQSTYPEFVFSYEARPLTPPTGDRPGARSKRTGDPVEVPR